MRSEFFKLTGQTICARQKSGQEEKVYVEGEAGNGRFKLVSCPRNNMAFAAGQLAVFQGASDEHILIDT